MGRNYFRDIACKLIYFGVILTWATGMVFVEQPVRTAQAGTDVFNDIAVNSRQDRLGNDDQCTLREAIISANKNSRSGSKLRECEAGSSTLQDRIILPQGEYLITRLDNGKEDSGSTGDFDIKGSLTIQADGAGVTIVGASGDRVFHILAGDVTLRNLTVQGGNHKGDGGGIYNAAKLTLDGITLTSNRADGSGGGILNAAGAMLVVSNSTVSGNKADQDGGGLLNQGSTTLNNVTITANIADANGDGSGNGGGTASPISAGILAASNTILAGNSDSSSLTQHMDCSGSLNSGGYNLIQYIDGCVISGDTASLVTGVDPMLELLRDNQGPTPTHALLAGSPAIDSGSPAVPGSGDGTCELTDQRGTSRPRGVACDIGAVEADSPNASVLIRVSSDETTTTVVGRLNDTPNTTFTLQLYAGTDPLTLCSPAGVGTLMGDPIQVTTDQNGNIIFDEDILNAYVPRGQYVVARTIGPGNYTSKNSRCVRVGAGNDSWPNAFELLLQGSPKKRASVSDAIDLPGQSRWYKFSVEPDSRVIVTLTELPANYDLTLYKDIQAVFLNDIASTLKTDDLLRLGAEFAPEAFTPDAFTADVFSPESFTPEAFTPESFTPESFTPEAFTPESFTPEAFTPEAFTPEAFTPDAFAPESFTPESFTPESFTPEAFTPESFTPESFTSAQTRSLIAISAFDGLVGEGIRVNTWDNGGYFYARVRGRNGAFDPQNTFRLEVQQVTSVCAGLSEAGLPPLSLGASGPGYKTIILTNLGRMAGADVFTGALQDFASRDEVAGVVVDVPQDARVRAAYDLLDYHQECPAAANLVADSIKSIVDEYRAANPELEYVVIIGNDEVIPFFRHPDHSMLASEKNYFPPVLNGTTSQASLRFGYVLSQDDYGAGSHISYKDDQFPIPSLAVGRLVETPSDILAMLNAYLCKSIENCANVVPSNSAGIITPSSALVTGYDFLDDVANAVKDELVAGLGSVESVETLIAPQHLAPTVRFDPENPDDPYAWTADDLRAALLDQRHDLIFLAGHFSASSALAADYETRLSASEVASSAADLTNVVIYSAGCHAGYNIVTPHGVPGVTREPDWAQALASKGATLIGGTGYQYGDTDFIKYSERLYQLFTQQLRVGSGPVSIGKAMVAAKLAYLAETPYLRGIDEKSLLEATIFGLPMLSVDFTGERIMPTSQPSAVNMLTGYATNPGARLGLRFADLTVNPTLETKTLPLTNIHDASITLATYISGAHGIVSKPNEPVLPLENVNVSFPDYVLRGVGFREGDYVDISDVFMLTGASTTEIRGVHLPFQSNIFFPAKPWTINYFNAIANDVSGITQLALTPAQYVSNTPSSPTGTLRRFDQMKFRLFYSSNTQTYGGISTPALAAPPTIDTVASDVIDGVVRFRIRVVGNPAAGIQEVWVTYTDVSQGPTGGWASIDLSQNDPNDSTLWEGTLQSAAPNHIRYFVQAVNGVGLVSMSTNQGKYYVPGAEAGPTDPTELKFVDPTPNSGRYSTLVTLSAKLTSKGVPLPGETVVFALGPQSRLATTNGEGIATAILSIYGLPDEIEESEIRTSFPGAGKYQASYDTQAFTILKQGTRIEIDPSLPMGYPQDDLLVTATLKDQEGRRLSEETLIFVVSGAGESFVEAVITDYAGRARLGDIPLDPGTYQLGVYFSGDIAPLGLELSDDRYNSTFSSVTLTLLNHLPQATSDIYSVDEDQALSVIAPGILANDSDVDGHALIVKLVTGPMHGSLNLSPDGGFTYIPNPNFNGEDSFIYSADDGFDAVSALVRITVNPVNDAPVALPDAYSLLENPPLVISMPGVLGNDSDVDGDPLQASIVSSPSHGALSLNPDGSFTYTPDQDFSGVDSFAYKASDGDLESDTVIVMLSVNGAPNCSAALPSPENLWPPNGDLIPVSVVGVTDPEGDSVSIEFAAIRQDEPVGSSPDAVISEDKRALLIRSKRDGNGDGRVYHIYFNAIDVWGRTCNGEVLLGVVPHDQGIGLDAVDGGPLYDSTTAQ